MSVWQDQESEGFVRLNKNKLELYFEANFIKNEHINPIVISIPVSNHLNLSMLSLKKKNLG